MTLKKRKHYIPRAADCSNYYCPRYGDFAPGEAIPDNPRTPPALNLRDMLQDATGHSWCQSPECAKRHALMSYGATHGYPIVKAGKYALGRGSGFWRAALMLGTVESIEMYYSALLRPVDDVESA